MPSSKGYVRNYRQEYDRYHAKPTQKKRRAARNRANYSVGKKGMEVHHKDGNPLNNSKKNLTVRTKSSNRSFPRNRKAGKR